MFFPTSLCVCVLFLFLALYPAASASAASAAHLSHTSLSTTICHTHLCQPPSFTHTTLPNTIFHTHFCHTPSLSHIFVNHHLSHTTLSTTIFHTPLSTTIFVTHLCQPPSVTHNFVNHHLSHASLSHIFVNHHLSHTSLSTTICHTQLCQPPSFTHLCQPPSLSHIFVNHHLSHTTLSTTIFHTQLCQPPSFTHIFVTHHLEHHLSHASLSHTFVKHHLCHTPSVTHASVTHLCQPPFVTHHVSHTSLSHTIFHTHSSRSWSRTLAPVGGVAATKGCVCVNPWNIGNGTTPCCHAVFMYVTWFFYLALVLAFKLRLAFLLYMRKFRSTAGGHGSIHQSVANEATDVWRGYAVWSTARTCYRWVQVLQESWLGTDVKRWRGPRVVRFLLSTLLGTCLMCCLLSDCGRPGSTVFQLIKVNVIQPKFRGRSLVWRLTLLHLAELFDVCLFASCWPVWCLTDRMSISSTSSSCEWPTSPRRDFIISGYGLTISILTHQCVQCLGPRDSQGLCPVVWQLGPNNIAELTLAPSSSKSRLDHCVREFQTRGRNEPIVYIYKEMKVTTRDDSQVVSPEDMVNTCVSLYNMRDDVKAPRRYIHQGFTPSFVSFSNFFLSFSSAATDWTNQPKFLDWLTCKSCRRCKFQTFDIVGLTKVKSWKQFSCTRTCHEIHSGNHVGAIRRSPSDTPNGSGMVFLFLFFSVFCCWEGWKLCLPSGCIYAKPFSWLESIEGLYYSLPSWPSPSSSTPILSSALPLVVSRKISSCRWSVHQCWYPTWTDFGSWTWKARSSRLRQRPPGQATTRWHRPRSRQAQGPTSHQITRNQVKPPWVSQRPQKTRMLTPSMKSRNLGWEIQKPGWRLRPQGPTQFSPSTLGWKHMWDRPRIKRT